MWWPIEQVLRDVEVLKDAPVLSAMLFGIGALITWLWSRRSVRLAHQRVDQFKDRLSVSSPDEAADKIRRLEKQIEESKKPAFWGSS